jgi:hypothetical protein
LISEANLGFSGRTLFQRIRYNPLKGNTGAFFSKLRTTAETNSGMNTQLSLARFMQLVLYRPVA